VKVASSSENLGNSFGGKPLVLERKKDG